MSDIACGMKDAGLADFAARVNATHVDQWLALGLFDEGLEGWGSAFLQVVTMAHGEFKIATQSGSKGYFGRVTLDVEPTARNGMVDVQFDSAHAERWQNGARFGVEYILDHIPKRRVFPQGGVVRIHCIEGHEVDTSSVLIAFVTARALSQALQELGIQATKQPDFDAATGEVVFSK